MRRTLKLVCLVAAVVLLLSSSSAAAQGFNGDYLPFDKGRLRRFPLKRYEAPDALKRGEAAVVSGIKMQEEEGGEGAGPRLVFSSLSKGGETWRVATAASPYMNAVYEGDLDRNGIRDLVLAFSTGGNGLAPTGRLVFLTFDRRAYPTLFEATGFFDAKPDHIFDLADLDGDGRAELVFMTFNDGYWITNLYRVRDSRWSRVEGKFAGLNFPAYTRFTRRPNHRPVRPAPGRNPQAPDLLKQNSPAQEDATPPQQKPAPSLGALEANVGPEEARAAADFLAALQRAVASNRREEVARMALYPLRVRVGGRRVVLRNRRELLKRFDAVFNPKVKAALAAQKPEDLFRNWQGFMVGRGEVWFESLADTDEFKLIAVNN